MISRRELGGLVNLVTDCGTRWKEFYDVTLIKKIINYYKTLYEEKWLILIQLSNFSVKHIFPQTSKFFITIGKTSKFVTSSVEEER